MLDKILLMFVILSFLGTILFWIVDPFGLGGIDIQFAAFPTGLFFLLIVLFFLKDKNRFFKYLFRGLAIYDIFISIFALIALPGSLVHLIFTVLLNLGD